MKFGCLNQIMVLIARFFFDLLLIYVSIAKEADLW